jgi:glycosyltransferase involved in cell wall biosynthesis
MAAMAAGIPFSLINTFGDYGKDGKGLANDSPLRKSISAENPHDINVFFINADEMHHAYQHLGEHFHLGKYNIGYWAWELREFPDAWLPSLDLIDEIWAPSRFIQDAISQKTTKPVVYMPLAVAPPLTNFLTRSQLTLPEDKFIFLSFFDFTSYFQRKNPFAVVEAFRKAFSQHTTENALLLIKLNNWSHDDHNYKKFERAIRDSANIQVRKEVLTDQEMKSLVHCCDAFVSLHRSEGFGRGPAEAMVLGKPVIVTGYSGNMDYCNETNSFLVDNRLIQVKPAEYPYGVGQIWADADTDHAAVCMREAYEHRDICSEKAKLGQMTISRYFCPQYVGYRYQRRLQQLGCQTATR